MAFGVKHHHQTVLPDDPTRDVSATEWNESHDIDTLIALPPQVTDPISPPDGSIWYNVTTQQIMMRVAGVTIPVSPVSAATTTDVAPAFPKDGDLWWKSDVGVLFVYYDDGTSKQWVEASPAGGSSTGTFNNWSDAHATEILPQQNYISVGGNTYKRWDGDPALTLFTTADGAQWVPPLNQISFAHFADAGVTHQQAIQHCLDWCASYSINHPIYTTPNGDTGLPMTISGAGPQWQCTAPFNLTNSHAALTVVGGSYAMTGSGWTNADPYAGWVWHSFGALSAAQVEAIARRVYYRVWKSDCLFNCVGAFRVTFRDMRIDCRQNGGGFKLTANCIAENCYVQNCAGTGFNALNHPCTVSNCTVRQWEVGANPEFFDHTAYTGIALFNESADMRVEGGSFAWCQELGRFEGTNNLIRGGHWFNGMESYQHTGPQLQHGFPSGDIHELFQGQGRSARRRDGRRPPISTRMISRCATTHTIGITTAARQFQRRPMKVIWRFLRTMTGCRRPMT